MMHSLLLETGEHDFDQHIAWYKKKGDSTTVATFCSVIHLPMYKDKLEVSSWAAERVCNSTMRFVVQFDLVVAGTWYKDWAMALCR